MITEVNNYSCYEGGCSREIQCIDIARHLSFSRGSAFKCVWYAARDGKLDEAIADLEKALWYASKEKEAEVSPVAKEMFGLLKGPTSEIDGYRYVALATIIRGENPSGRIKEFMSCIEHEKRKQKTLEDLGPCCANMWHGFE